MTETFDPTSPAVVAAILDEAERLQEALEHAAAEGRNVLPDATDDQAAIIEAWALTVLGRAGK